MPNWSPETDRRPAVVGPELIGTLYDAALDGEPLLLEWSGKGGFASGLGAGDAVGYEQRSATIGIEQTSTSDDIAENKLSPDEFWRSMRDWQGGFGQKRFDVPKVSQPNAYRDSWNVDTRVPGQVTLCRSVAASAPATFDVGSDGATGTASETCPQGLWFISQKGTSQQAVTLYDLSTFTTKTLAQAPWFNDVAIAPDDTVYLSANNGLFKVTPATSIVAWVASDPNTVFTVLRAAKQRLFSVGRVQSAGGPFGIYEIPTEGTAGAVVPVLKLTLSSGVYCADIKEAGGLVLIAVTGGNTNSGPGVIYAYDGTNAPYRALVFERGEDIVTLQPVLGGTVVLIVTNRKFASGNNRHALYVTSVQGSQLGPAQLVAEYPDEYVYGSSCFEATTIGGFVFFGGQSDLLLGTGFSLDAYNYAEGTAAHHLLPPTAETGTARGMRGITQYNGRLVWFESQAGSMKVLTESSTGYVPSGYVVTSAVDLNVDAPKQWTVVEVAALPLKPGEKIEVYWTADRPEAGDWRLVGTLTAGQTTHSWPLGVISRQLSLKAVLSGPGTSTPTLQKLGVAAQMARLPKLVHQLRVQAYARMDRLDRSPFERAKTTYVHELVAHLEALRQTGRAVWFQSPLSRHDGHADLVKVGQVVKRLRNDPAQGTGGEVAVELNNVLPDRRNLWPLAVASHSSVPISLVNLDLYESVGTVTYTNDFGLPPWTTGAGFSDKFGPNAVSGGVRFPKVHTTTVWDPVLHRGLPLSASVVASPYLAGLKLTLALEFWDGTDTLRKTVTSKVFTLDSVGKWYPLYVEGVTTDDVAGFGLLYVTGKVLVDASSSVGSFALDGAQLEQARLSTRWQAPPSAY